MRNVLEMTADIVNSMATYWLIKAHQRHYSEALCLLDLVMCIAAAWFHTHLLPTVALWLVMDAILITPVYAFVTGMRRAFRRIREKAQSRPRQRQMYPAYKPSLTVTKPVEVKPKPTQAEIEQKENDDFARRQQLVNQIVDTDARDFAQAQLDAERRRVVAKRMKGQSA